jgi:hypothetical protein
MDMTVFQYTAVITAMTVFAVAFICFSETKDDSDVQSEVTDDTEDVQEEVSDETDDFEEYIGERMSSSQEFRNKIRNGLTKLRFRHPRIYAEVMRK